MKKLRTLQQIKEAGVVAVLRGGSAAEVRQMAERAIEGGIKIIEITMTVPSALQAIEQLAAAYPESGDVVIGAGTVLDPETARMTIYSGARFVVSPSFSRETMLLCNRYRIPLMPGTMTIQEIQTALEYGADVVKLFPGNLYSPEMIKSVHGPLPQANIMPTGGVNLQNLADWIKAGAFAVGIGSDLTKEAVAKNVFSLIADKARAYMAAFAETQR